MNIDWLSFIAGFIACFVTAVGLFGLMLFIEYLNYGKPHRSERVMTDEVVDQVIRRRHDLEFDPLMKDQRNW
jgi:hypothetical protein